MFPSTADSLIPGALGGYRPPLDPLDASKLLGKTMRWWQAHGLFELARQVLFDHERMVKRRVDEHHEECAECLGGNLKCSARRRLIWELD